MDSDRTGPYERRLTVAEAADVLGISAEAVRGRVRRGTLRVEREHGAVFVILDSRPTGDQPRTTSDRTTDRSGESDALISQLRDENAFLRDQVQRQQEIIAQQAVTMRQLSAASSQEPTEDVETVGEGPEVTEPQSDAAGPQAGAQRPQGGGLRGLRRRILGW